MDKPITPDTKVIQRIGLPNVELDGEIALFNVEKGSYYGLDKIGSRVWAIMAEQITVKEIVDRLLHEYEVKPEICEKDVMDLIKQLNMRGLVNLL